MKPIYIAFLLFLTFGFCSVSASAQISINANSFSYTENFNTLGTPINPISITLPGWQIVETGSGGNADNKYGNSNGNTATGDTYSFGAQNNTERALGSLQSNSVAPIFGVAFTNNTGNDITSFTVQYTGEQWRIGSPSFHIDSLIFQYSLTATGVGGTSSSWVTVNSLIFSSVVTSASSANALNGNNNTASLSGTVSVNIPAGTTFRMRWVDANITGADDALAIDGFTASFVAASPLVTIAATGIPACTGSNVNFTATVPAGTPTLQWRVNGQPVPGANTASFTYTSWTAGDIVDLFVTPSGGTAYATNAITIVADTNRIWTGLAGDNLWSTANNWSCNTIPTASDNVSIPATASVIVTEPSDCLNLTIVTGGAISFSGTNSPQLHVHAALANDGTINTADGTLQVDQP